MRKVWERRTEWKGQIVRLASGVGGGMILYHEVWITETAEPLLVFLGLWLFGIPPVMFFEGLRKVGQRASSELDSAMTGDTNGAPERKPERPAERDGSP